jgi:hypothetical protein
VRAAGPRPSLHACVQALKPGGLFVFTVNHPCFEQLWPTWRYHGAYRTHRYLGEYEIPGPSGVDFHRTISAYLNQLIRLGCQVVEVAEPGLSPEIAADGPEGIDAYVHLPNFLIVAARRTPSHPRARISGRLSPIASRYS